MLFTYFGQSFLNISFAQTLFKTKNIQEALPFPHKVKSGDTYIKKRIAISNDVLLVCGPISWWRHTPGQASSLLNKGIEEIIDRWRIDSIILDIPECPIEKEEKEIIIIDRNYSLKKTIIKETLKFNFKNVSKLMKLSPLLKIICSKRLNTPLFKAGSSPTNPLMTK